MAREKTRYKAVIDNQTYTIIGTESKRHMDLVTKLVNEQLDEIREMSPDINNEQAAILLAVNAISDQLNKQGEVLKLEKEIRELKQRVIHVTELENKVKRIEAMENEARDVLKQAGREDVEIHNHLEAQQVLNANRKKQIKQKSSQN